jgi:hypothetical protein
MDDQRFDDLTRRFAGRATSRRNVLRTAGAGIISSVASALRLGGAEAAPPPGKGKCPTGQTKCRGTCVATSTDPANCGQCSTTCTSGITCCGGQCRACSAPRTLNPTTCACDCPACSVNQAPDPTSCACGCPSGTTLCGGQCVSTSCPSGQVFNTTTCGCGCVTGTALCNGQCMSTLCSTGQTFSTTTCACECSNTCAAPQVLNTSTCACECPGGCGICETCDPVRGCVSTGVDGFVVNARPPCGSGPQGCFCTTDKNGRGYCSSGGSCEGQTLTCATDADCEAKFGAGSVCAPTAAPGCFGGVACLTPCPNP